MANTNALAVIDTTKVSLIPTAEDMTAINEELQDIDRVPFGRIKIAAAGANVFQITEPGEEDEVSATEVQGIIFMSHKCNAYWATKYGTGNDTNKSPDCSSYDGKTGIITETGECRECATCPYNEFGSDPEGGRGKACKNMRRLYILREGDILPMVLALPSTALRVYDNYRTRLATKHKTPVGVVTKITLKSAKNADGVKYSTPVFEPAGALPAETVAQVKAFAAQFEGIARSVGITEEETVGGDANAYVPSKPCPVSTQDGGEFVEVKDKPLPF